jgi:3-ketoacyl-CoA synthase
MIEFPPRAFPDGIDAVLGVVKASRLPALGLALGLALNKARSTWDSHDVARKAITESCVAASAQKLVDLFRDDIGALLLVLSVLGLLWLIQRWIRRERVFLMDFECFSNREENWVPYEVFERRSRQKKCFSEDALDFQLRMLNKSGVAGETMFPNGLQRDPPEPTMAWAREEAEMVLFSVVENLLKKTGIKPREIDVLVVNCSLFNPTPSLSAMIINKFKMRTNIESYNLGGMGCSAGAISIGLAKRMLGSLNRGGYALVVSTENITQNWYQGNERSMLIPNTIFRMGGAAMLLTNKTSEARRSLYELEHVVRVHLGAQDDAFRCVYQHEDAEQKIGVELNKDLVKVAARALEVNLTKMGPLVLPWGEKLAFAANWIARKLFMAKMQPYIPRFNKAFDHFCLHAGGRAVVTGLSRQLNLTEEKMAPSANSLHWYGNTYVWFRLPLLSSLPRLSLSLCGFHSFSP